MAEESLAQLARNARRTKSILYWRPLIAGLNDSDADINQASELSRLADATVFTGLFHRQEIRAYLRDAGVKDLYGQAPQRKILPRDLEARVLERFSGGPLFRKTSCGVAIRHALREPPTARNFERRDRLPLSRAQEEAKMWAALSPHRFMVKLIEVWVIAQHTYWCVVRGLADARNDGKTILRMRIVMEENGWTLTPDTSGANPPEATPDRLDTAVSLLWECDRLN